MSPILHGATPAPATPTPSPAQTGPVLTGSDLIQLTNDRLAGYQNAIDPRALIGFLNEAKDEIWVILKGLEKEYFIVATEYSDSNQTNYFGPLATNLREYSIPGDLRAVEFIECVTPGYETAEFVFRNINDDDFKDQRRAATLSQSTSGYCQEFLYTILGKNQLVLAAFPPVALQLVIWYLRALPDFEDADAIDEILFPFSKKLADFACKKAMLAVQDPNQFMAWSAEWKSSVVMIAQGASPRNEADAEFVTGMFE